MNRWQRRAIVRLAESRAGIAGLIHAMVLLLKEIDRLAQRNGYPEPPFWPIRNALMAFQDAHAAWADEQADRIMGAAGRPADAG